MERSMEKMVIPPHTSRHKSRLIKKVLSGSNPKSKLDKAFISL
jgi:hypothetical protein